MKNNAIILLACIFVTAFQAAATSLSETNNGIYLGVAGWRPESSSGFVTNEVIHYDDKLLWRPFCRTGFADLNYPDYEYGIKIRLLQADGNEVPKSKLGEGFGSKFDQVRTYQDVIRGWHMGSISAQGTYGEYDEFTGPTLPSAKELFQIEKSGIYTLEIQMQMFLIHKNTNQWTRELIRFSPIDIQVSKP